MAPLLSLFGLSPLLPRAYDTHTVKKNDFLLMNFRFLYAFKFAKTTNTNLKPFQILNGSSCKFH